MPLDDEDLKAMLEELRSRIEALEAQDELDDDLAELLVQYRGDVAKIVTVLKKNQR